MLNRNKKQNGKKVNDVNIFFFIGTSSNRLQGIMPKNNGKKTFKGKISPVYEKQEKIQSESSRVRTPNVSFPQNAT